MNEQSLSITIGKGSLNHNCRKFIAKNVDKERIKDNITIKEENIHHVYHKLFDEALIKYNSKQTRSDRKINDYYEKIRTGKQEKLFHEIIVQIGNKDTLNCKSKNGFLGQLILQTYMNDFEKRNPYLYVFSAHIHMDEETPHLHLDFIPFTTNSKRGLETRVSLKQALKNQGFHGGTRHDTELNQWINTEKIALEEIMLSYRITPKHLNTHEQHLDVYDYKKKKRIEEIKQLEENIANIKSELEIKYEDQFLFNKYYNQIADDSIWELPDPKRFMSALSYKKGVVIPFINTIRSLCKTAIIEVVRLKNDISEIRSRYYGLQDRADYLEKKVNSLLIENKDYHNKFKKLEKILGRETIKEILDTKIIKEEKHRSFER